MGDTNLPRLARMGIVYRGYDTATQREIAVKVPLGKFVDDDEARKQFAREAEAWTGLIHPHIVHAFDVRDDQTTDYRPAIFMDYCDGGSLADRLRNGPPLSMGDALDIAIQICWAMEFAHEKGHIHRDLKPGNVLLTKDGKALVSDFGLVKRLDVENLQAGEGQLNAADEGLSATLTQGTAVGTHEYMPPEQWAGKACKQSDIYAFGIMLYELFCGRQPFAAEKGKRWELRKMHALVPPPDPRRLNPRLTEVLAQAMLQCLAKDHSGRLDSFGSLAGRLERAYGEAAGHAHSTRRQKPTAAEISRADKEARARALTRLGLGRMRRGELCEADRHCRQSLSLFESLGDQAGMGRCYANMAVVADERGNYDEAMELYHKAMAVFEHRGDRAMIGGCCQNMGEVARARGNYQEAMRLYRKALSICERVRDQVGMPSCYVGMGLVARARSHYDEAMEFYRRALTMFERLGDQAGMGRCYSNMAALAQKTGDAAKMRQYVRLAAQLNSRIGVAVSE
jgi:tetratricopeptide (TPR) repeat protein